MNVTSEVEYVHVLHIILFPVYYLQMEEKRTTEERKNTEKQESYSVKKRTMDLLPDAENNIAKLQVSSRCYHVMWNVIEKFISRWWVVFVSCFGIK